MLARRKLLALSLIVALAPTAAFATGAGSEKKKGGGLSFIQFPTLTATVFRPDGDRGVLTVEAGIDVPDEKLHDRANLSEPRLRAAYVEFLRVYAGGLPPGAPPNADYIAQQLQAQTNRVLGQPGAKLLIGTILIN